MFKPVLSCYLRPRSLRYLLPAVRRSCCGCTNTPAVSPRHSPFIIAHFIFPSLHFTGWRNPQSLKKRQRVITVSLTHSANNPITGCFAFEVCEALILHLSVIKYDAFAAVSASLCRERRAALLCHGVFVIRLRRLAKEKLQPAYYPTDRADRSRLTFERVG